MKTFSISQMSRTIVVYLLFLSILILFIGCSSKNDQNSASKSEPCSTSEPCSISVPESNSEKTAPPQNIDSNEPNKERSPIVRRQNIPACNKPSISDIQTELSYVGTTSERKIELLESLNVAGMEQDPNIIGVVQKALEDPNADVGQAAIAMLYGYQDPAILPAVELAIKNNDEEIRRAAVELLADVDAPQVGNLIAQALNDTSEDIRDAALDIIEKQTDDVQLRILENAIASPYDDVKDAAVSKLQSRGDKKAVDVLINAIKNDNSDFRETVSDTLEFLIEQKFDTFEHAQSWWKENNSKYDENLMLIETDSTKENP